MSKIILVAESGSDITPELAEQYGVYVVPMHVAFDETTLDDGSFPPEKIVEFYQSTGRLPRTSGSTPDDFTPIFDRIHAEHPDAQILYLAYSAITTCSYQSAVIAAEGLDYVHPVDTRQVSVGQCAVVVEVAKALQANPDVTIQEAIAKSNEIIDRARMCFLPDNLEFLRAGGRVSNVVALGSRILSLHPTIEILEGKLTATKKYRGKMEKVAAQLVTDYAESYDLDRDTLWLIWTVGLSDAVKDAVKQAAADCGFRKLEWIRANGVITTHGGPAAFGIAGFAKA